MAKLYLSYELVQVQKSLKVESPSMSLHDCRDRPTVQRNRVFDIAFSYMKLFYFPSTLQVHDFEANVITNAILREPIL